MIRNGNSLLVAAPIKDMVPAKIREHGVSYGLGEAGYDIRIKQRVRFRRKDGHMSTRVDGVIYGDTRFVIASAIEEFDMPDNLVGVVHDKSTWARQGLSVFNTVIEPGWKGFLTLELVYHGHEELLIPAGAGIAQVVFHETTDRTAYTGKYQNQEDAPVSAKDS
jgi:Deoxycytidine deaminase